VSKTVLCSTDIKRKRWAWMLTQPVQPPRFYAGLDMAKDDLWTGLKIDDAERPPATDPDKPGGGLCQSNALVYEGACPSGFGGCTGCVSIHAQRLRLMSVLHRTVLLTVGKPELYDVPPSVATEPGTVPVPGWPLPFQLVAAPGGEDW